MWAKMIPMLISLATKNNEGAAKAEDIGGTIRKAITSARTAKSVSEAAPWQ